jgi:hypothetical protein
MNPLRMTGAPEVVNLSTHKTRKPGVSPGLIMAHS